MGLTLTKDKGEWLEIRATLTDPETKRAIDWTGGSLAMIGYTSGNEASPTYTTTGQVDRPTEGKGKAGCLLSTAGTFTFKLTADLGGAPGWPAIGKVTVYVVP